MDPILLKIVEEVIDHMDQSELKILQQKMDDASATKGGGEMDSAMPGMLQDEKPKMPIPDSSQEESGAMKGMFDDKAMPDSGSDPDSEPSDEELEELEKMIKR